MSACVRSCKSTAYYTALGFRLPSGHDDNILSMLTAERPSESTSTSDHKPPPRLSESPLTNHLRIQIPQRRQNTRIQRRFEQDRIPMVDDGVETLFSARSCSAPGGQAHLDHQILTSTPYADLEI